MTAAEKTALGICACMYVNSYSEFFFLADVRLQQSQRLRSLMAGMHVKYYIPDLHVIVGRE